jgi:1-acyl-sn-glycerol-3-phosphate acyltransferase
MDTLSRWLERSYFFWIAYHLVKTYVRLFYGLKIYGQDNVPLDGGIVVASNHISAMDPPVIGVSIPRESNYMAKKELFEIWWLKPIIMGLRSYPVDRSKSDLGAMKDSIRRLNRGVAVGIFIQGTRNEGDAEALNGAAFLAQRAGAPIVPAAIWRQGRAYCVRFGTPITPEGKSKAEMKTLTDETMARIRGMLPQLEVSEARAKAKASQG